VRTLAQLKAASADLETIVSMAREDMRAAARLAAIDAGADGFYDHSAADATDRIVATIEALPLTCSAEPSSFSGELARHPKGFGLKAKCPSCGGTFGVFPGRDGWALRRHAGDRRDGGRCSGYSSVYVKPL